jgi:hypothetical protein
MEELIIGLYENRLFVDLPNIFYEKALSYLSFTLQNKKAYITASFFVFTTLDRILFANYFKFNFSHIAATKIYCSFIST